jgi:CRISPR-associated protein Csx14
MSRPEPSFSVKLDRRNPGQFFACCGLLELAHRLSPEAEGWFREREFCIHGSHGLESILSSLESAHVVALEPGEDPKIPPLLLGDPFNLRIDWWVDDRGRKSLFGKMFSGQKRTLHDAIRLQKVFDGRARHDRTSLFDWAVPLKGRFGLDPRSAWTALDVGFSPNDQGMEVGTYPAVELLGAIGLQGFRPVMKNGRFRYATWRAPLAAPVARAAASGLLVPVTDVAFRFQLMQRGSYKGFDWALPQGEEDE